MWQWFHDNDSTVYFKLLLFQTFDKSSRRVCFDSHLSNQWKLPTNYLNYTVVTVKYPVNYMFWSFGNGCWSFLYHVLNPRFLLISIGKTIVPKNALQTTLFCACHVPRFYHLSKPSTSQIIGLSQQAARWLARVRALPDADTVCFYRVSCSCQFVATDEPNVADSDAKMAKAAFFRRLFSLACGPTEGNNYL